MYSFLYPVPRSFFRLLEFLFLPFLSTYPLMVSALLKRSMIRTDYRTRGLIKYVSLKA